ncbi:MAG: IS4 family transposase [Blastocatellia bacterium]
MRDIRSLEQTLALNLTWHKARIKFVAAFVIALLTVKNVNLVELACAFAGQANQESHYKKLQRFFRFFEIPCAELAHLLVKLLGVEGPWTLSLDRTNWQFGQTDLNILMLGIVHQGIAWPLVRVVLPKAGNSHTDERILVLEIFLDLFGKEQIECLLADREFVGRDWLAWLRRHEINFHLRVRENFQVANARGQFGEVRRLFRATRVNQPLLIAGPRRMWDEEWFFSGCYLGSGEYLILVSPTATADAVEQYARRWEIETLFAALKTRGFCLEQTHLRDPERLSRLLALLALTFCWCHKVGEWLHAQQALKLNKYGRRPKSLFRRGFDHLRRLIVNFSRFDLAAWQLTIKLLSCT